MSRILLLLAREGNRRLLAESLEDRYDVVRADRDRPLPTDFDLCLVDPPALETCGEDLRHVREEVAPVFLPVLLVTARQVPPSSALQVWETVDEVLRTPVSKAELDTRISALLRARSQSRQLEEQLLSAQRMEAIGVLAGGLVHDLNNLLTVIHNNAELLVETLAPDDPGREEAARITAAVERGSELTRQLLGLSRRTRSEDEGEVIDLNQIVDTTARIVGATLPSDIDLVQQLQEEPVAVTCAPVRLEQVLMNLVVNAVDAMTGPGTIELHTGIREVAEDGTESEPRAYALLDVSDTGPGFDEDTAAQIFEPFFTTKEEGTGLGLASVAHIVRDAGGSVEVESTPGQGSTFRILLPLGELPDDDLEAEQEASHALTGEAGAESDSDRRPPTDVDEDAEPPPRRSATVLVVDDEPDIRHVVGRLLRRAGHDVVAAADAEEAFEQIREHGDALDLVLLDSILPGLERASIVDLIRRAGGSRARIAFMSGYGREEVTQRVGSLGDAPFLEKPFSAKAVLRLVEETVRGAYAREDHDEPARE